MAETRTERTSLDLPEKKTIVPEHTQDNYNDAWVNYRDGKGREEYGGTSGKVLYREKMAKEYTNRLTTALREYNEALNTTLEELPSTKEKEELSKINSDIKKYAQKLKDKKRFLRDRYEFVEEYKKFIDQKEELIRDANKTSVPTEELKKTEIRIKGGKKDKKERKIVNAKEILRNSEYKGINLFETKEGTKFYVIYWWKKGGKLRHSHITKDGRLVGKESSSKEKINSWEEADKRKQGLTKNLASRKYKVWENITFLKEGKMYEGKRKEVVIEDKKIKATKKKEKKIRSSESGETKRKKSSSSGKTQTDPLVGGKTGTEKQSDKVTKVEIKRRRQ